MYKGKLAKEAYILPVNFKLIDKDSLILMQKQLGRGPALRVMKVIPAKEAESYLKLLK